MFLFLFIYIIFLTQQLHLQMTLAASSNYFGSRDKRQGKAPYPTGSAAKDASCGEKKNRASTQRRVWGEFKTFQGVFPTIFHKAFDLCYIFLSVWSIQFLESTYLVSISLSEIKEPVSECGRYYSILHYMMNIVGSFGDYFYILSRWKIQMSFPTNHIGNKSLYIHRLFMSLTLSQTNLKNLKGI